MPPPAPVSAAPLPYTGPPPPGYRPRYYGQPLPPLGIQSTGPTTNYSYPPGFSDGTLPYTVPPPPGHVPRYYGQPLPPLGTSSNSNSNLESNSMFFEQGSRYDDQGHAYGDGAVSASHGMLDSPSQIAPYHGELDPGTAAGGSGWTNPYAYQHYTDQGEDWHEHETGGQAHQDS
ncbi:hypothetical protein FB45DRAFT_868213 [Roridomyces roridus]|uniref:Uncharacterized protein n=1 Tax=Roridomyces roridus TaxID=1738132 RepID=A0AAD7FM83_9AGAR|nr:hypothetical protein FB45DRAFT_868213 [Roridomyces roridus]